MAVSHQDQLVEVHENELAAALGREVLENEPAVVRERCRSSIASNQSSAGRRAASCLGGHCALWRNWKGPDPAALSLIPTSDRWTVSGSW